MRTIAIRSGPIAVAKATVALLWRRITFLRAISACSLAVLSCSAPNNGTTGEETASPQEPISWEDFKHAATRHYKGREIYIVEWDLPVTEDQLRERYDAYVRGVRNANGGVESVSQASSVERVNGVDDVWHGYQMWLTYCVSNTFGADKARVVSEMQNATAAWESVARVRFFYEPDQDELCDSDDNNFNDFFFAVRPWAEDGSAAFFPSQKASGIPGIIHIDLQSYPSNAFWFYRPNVTTEGALRHELGHVLGLEHEHDRCASGYTGAT